MLVCSGKRLRPRILHLQTPCLRRWETPAVATQRPPMDAPDVACERLSVETVLQASCRGPGGEAPGQSAATGKDPPTHAAPQSLGQSPDAPQKYVSLEVGAPGQRAVHQLETLAVP